LISERTPKAKAGLWVSPDTETRKLGERSRLETCVVLAVNDPRQLLVEFSTGGEANALSGAPGEYERKLKTQRN